MALGYGEISSKRLAGVRSDPLRGFRFKVFFPGFNLPQVGFSKISGISLGDSDLIEYREGDYEISPRKIPGLNKFENVTMERGVSFNNEVVMWRRNVAYAGSGAGFSQEGYPPGAEFRKNLHVLLIDRNGITSKMWQLIDAWPKSLKYSDMDALTSDVFIETLEIATEGIDIIDLGGVSAAVGTGLNLGGQASTLII